MQKSLFSSSVVFLIKHIIYQKRYKITSYNTNMARYKSKVISKLLTCVISDVRYSYFCRNKKNV
nr:MAG TPA: hypothetical protein [Caudoviricetes sp.]